MTNHRSQGGQILPLFILALVAILAMTALLFDGANALASRRKLQNAGDAAALAGANVLQAAASTRTCSTVGGPPPGAPRQDIVDAVLASLRQNLPGFPASNVTITCPEEWNNSAVRVDLRDPGTAYFAGAILGGAIAVGTTSAAVNGINQGSIFSVVQLNPWNPSWHQSRRGCPSFLISGGPTLEFEGSIQVNSACPAADGGAMGANGGSATVNLTNNARVRLVGGFNPGPLTIAPPPLTGQRPFPDPLAALAPVPVDSLTVRSTTRLVLNNQAAVLQPGVYKGGIELRNTSRALLRPGIYVLDGGGLSVGSQASFCSISATATPGDCSTFEADCPDATCGVLLFNRGAASGTGAMGPISVSAGASLRLRAYDERAAGDAYPNYRNLLIWQDRNPQPTSSWSQPVIKLNGGGSVQISGTLYAPSALIEMGGSSGGSGGSSVNLTLQFISWDLTLYGNSSFSFRFSEDDFALPLDYGLVQ
jgi:Flp pilus assembly protein TadG